MTFNIKILKCANLGLASYISSERHANTLPNIFSDTTSNRLLKVSLLQFCPHHFPVKKLDKPPVPPRQPRRAT